jgi:hypothetical protein
MARIPNSKSFTEARSSVETLCTLIGQLIESNTDMSNRLRILESSMLAPQNDAVNDDIASIATTTSLKQVHSDRHLDPFHLDFEDTLFATRVYRNTLPRNSVVSLTSTAQWSVLSGFSLADVSNISILSLPLSASELYNSRWYDKAQRSGGGSATEEPERLGQWSKSPRYPPSVLGKTNSDRPKPRSETGRRIECFLGGEKALKEKEREKAIEKMRTMICDHFQRPNKVTESFITIGSLQKVWHWELKDFVEGQGLEVSRDQLDFISKHLLRTLSILVYIEWKKWPKFKRIFMRDQGFREDRLDSKLPHDIAILRDESFLKKSLGQKFFGSQYIFVPIILTQGKFDTYPIERRLPLNTDTVLLGSGAFGIVTKEVIPAGYLVLMHDNKEVGFRKPYLDIN